MAFFFSFHLDQLAATQRGRFGKGGVYKSDLGGLGVDISEEKDDGILQISILT